MRKTLAVLLLFLCSLGAFAKGGHSSHSSGSSSHTRSSSGKTVHVRGYTRKDGTHVKAYNRRPPGTANSKHKK